MLRGTSAFVTAFVLAAGLALGAAGCKEEGLKIKRVEPSEGDHHGDVVTIHGSGFDEKGIRPVQVYFGGQKASVLEIEGDDKIKVRHNGGQTNEKVDIKIIFADSRAIEVEDAYKFIDPAPLGVDDLTEGKQKEK